MARVRSFFALVHISAGGEEGEWVPVAGETCPAGTVEPARAVDTHRVTATLP